MKNYIDKIYLDDLVLVLQHILKNTSNTNKFKFLKASLFRCVLSLKQMTFFLKYLTKKISTVLVFDQFGVCNRPTDNRIISAETHLENCNKLQHGFT